MDYSYLHRDSSASTNRREPASNANQNLKFLSVAIIHGSSPPPPPPPHLETPEALSARGFSCHSFSHLRSLAKQPLLSLAISPTPPVQIPPPPPPNPVPPTSSKQASPSPPLVFLRCAPPPARFVREFLIVIEPVRLRWPPDARNLFDEIPRRRGYSPAIARFFCRDRTRWRRWDISATRTRCAPSRTFPRHSAPFSGSGARDASSHLPISNSVGRGYGVCTVHFCVVV